MKLPEIGVKRPVFTSMLFIAIVLFGVIAFRSLPTDLLPDVELPTLTIATVYPGASAVEVEQQVTKHLEDILSGISKLKSITSNSRENVSFITLQFNWGTDMNEAASNARDLIELKKRYLPADAEAPIIAKINSSMIPVIIYGVNAKENFNGLHRILEDKINTPLKKIAGVGTVLVISAPTREISINVDPDKLKAYKLSVPLIAQTLKMSNISIPGGNIKTSSRDFAVRVPGEFTNAGDIANMPITTFGGKIIFLKDVATVYDGIKDKDEVLRINNKHAAGIFVQKQSGANTLEVAKAVKKEVARIQKTLPKDVEIKLLLDSSEIVSSSINNLKDTIIYAALFVVFVVLLFLRNIRSSIIVIVSIPISLIAAFIYMAVAKFSINVFSLMSLAIAIGIVVDNAIVVLENITRHIEKGVHPKQAAVFATGEMGLAITASTLTIIAVFIPMIFMGGIVGILFGQLAILTSVTLLASLLVSVMLTPMMASKMLKPISKERKKQNKLFQVTEKAFIAVENAYFSALHWAVIHRWQVIVFCIALFASALLIAKTIGSDYMPQFEAGDLKIVMKTEVGTNVKETERIAMKAEKVVRDNVPELELLYTVAGQTESGIFSMVGFSEGKNIANVMCKVKITKGGRTSKDIAIAISDKIAQIPEIESFSITSGSVLMAATLGSKKPVQINIMGKDFSKMNAAARMLMDSLNHLKGLMNVESTIDKGKMEMQINIDKNKAASMGLNTAMIAMQVRQSIYGAEAGNFDDEGYSFTINVRYDNAFKKSIDDVGSIMLITLTGQQVKLSSVATITGGTGLLEVKHESSERIVMVTSELKGISLGEGNKMVSRVLGHCSFPDGVDVNMSGELSEQKESFSRLIWIFLIGILLVYMIMASQFESLKYPLIIMFTVPLSIVGVVLVFKLLGLTLSVITFVGIIMLIGIDLNQAIILVDYTNLMRKRGMSLIEAVTETGRHRLRPVMMTAFAAILGMIPMAVSSGSGSEIWAPFGITCIGGLLVSKFFTMFLIPVLYVSVNRKTLKSEKVVESANI